MIHDLMHILRAVRSGEGLRGRLARSGMGTIAVRAGGMALAFLASVILARSLGTGGYGVYAFAMSVVLVVSTATKLGFPRLLVREVASLAAERRWSGLKRLLAGAEKRVLLASLLAGAVVALAILLMPRWPGPDRQSTLLWALGLIPLLSLGELRSCSLRGLGRIALGLTPEALVRPALLICFIVLFYLMTTGSQPPPATAMALHVLAGALALATATVWLLRKLETGTSANQGDADSWQWTRLAVPFLGLDVIQIINSQADILVLGLLRPPGELGVYRVGVAIGSVVPFLFSAANVVVQPEISRLHSQGKGATLQRLLDAEVRAAFSATLPIVLLLVAGGAWLLELVYGADYTAAYLPLVILAIGQLVQVGAGPGDVVLNMTGNERETIRGMGMAAFWNVGVNFALIPFLGATGAALARASSHILLKVFLAFRAVDVVGFNPSVIGSGRRRGRRRQ